MGEPTKEQRNQIALEYARIISDDEVVDILNRYGIMLNRPPEKAELALCSYLKEFENKIKDYGS